MKIFLSYGHDEYENIAQRLKRDLEQEGYDIWIDKDGIKGTAEWEAAIENGISTSDWLVLLMTEHSVRRPDGVCLDEVSYARFLGKNIAPIMIQEVKPPLCIARIQWIDMKNFLIPGKAFFDEEAYQEKKGELISILKGVQTLTIEGGQKSLRSKLSPLDNDVFSEHFRKSYYGRKALIEYYDEWVQSKRKVLWLVGDAGIGKTAFVANLSAIRDDIQAVHFCRYNDNERANPKRAIMSISYYLSTQIPEYKKQILELQDLDALIEKNTERLFEYLIVEPLSKVTYHGNTVVIAIDALDEATVDGRNELADVVAKHFEKTPPWVKLLVTSRREALLERKMSKFHPIDLSDSNFNDNNSDIMGYYSMCLGACIPAGKKGRYILSKLVAKSQGIFLYAKTIVDEVRSGYLSIEDIDDFPDGLTGIYLDYFDRIFSSSKDFSYKKDIRPVMEILCATCEPVSECLLCDILEIDEYDISDICELISEMFPVRNGVIEPIHKSIVDWLIDPKRSGQYRVSARRGHGKIADYYINTHDKKRFDRYAVQYLGTHLLSDNRIQELVDLLCDSEFTTMRIRIMGLDSAIRRILYELETLSEHDLDSVDMIFESESFSSMFSNYRKFFYNSGLYFHLKNCGFDRILRNGLLYDSTDGQIGIAYYYYITESFSDAIECVEKILASDLTLSPSEQAELHNLLALCYRKSVDFGKAEEHFRKAFDVACDTTEHYNQSISLVNLGKISYHRLDWESADRWNELAIKHLEDELNIVTNEDYKIVLELFLAEYHRLCAECLIWKGDLSRVDIELSIAKKIYDRVQTRDRYYIRFLYTSVFSNVLTGKYEEVLEDCELLMQHATSSYDKSQILFYRSMAALKLNQVDECVKYVSEAYRYAKSIGAWLEMEEVVAVAEKLPTKIKDIEHSVFFDTNLDIRKWIRYANSFIEQIPGGL